MIYLNKSIALTILGLEPNKIYDKNEIKKAYKSKALLYHPDKCKKDTSNEFLKISAAYQFLIDQNSNINNSNTNVFPSEIFFTFTSKFLRFIKKVLEETEEKIKKNDYDDNSSNDEFFDLDDSDSEMDKKDNDKGIKITLDVSIKDLYQEYGKKLSIKYIDNEKKIKSRNILIPFVNYQRYIVYENFGDWNENRNKYDDLIVFMNIINHKIYTINDCINDFDLIRSFDISVSDYYDNIILIFDHFGEKVTLTHNPYKNGKEIICKGKGLKRTNDERGDLYIILNIDMTICDKSNLETHQRELLSMFPSLYKIK